MKVFRTALAAASLLAMGSQAFAAISPLFDFVPVATSQTGGSVVITARISGLDDSATIGVLDEVLAAFSLFIEYDSSKLSYTGGTFLAGAQFTDPVTSLVDANFADTPASSCGAYGGTMTATCFTLDTSLADADLFIAQGSSGGSFNLFSMSFTLLDTSTAWTATIGVAGTNGFTPEFIGSEVNQSGPTILAMNFGSARVTNVPSTTPPTQGIPEPGTYGLAAMALLAAGVVTRRRRGA